LREFFDEDIRSTRIPPDLDGTCSAKIQMIDDATMDQDLRVPPSNHFEKLAGKLERFLSIGVNSNGGSSSSGMMAEVRRRTSIWTTQLSVR
jgi:toxin HigB-1